MMIDNSSTAVFYVSIYRKSGDSTGHAFKKKLGNVFRQMKVSVNSSGFSGIKFKVIILTNLF